jgi:hypothetical protein
MKLTVTKSKNSACFYVQKSIRKPNGAGTTTITIEKLGNIDEVKAKAQNTLLNTILMTSFPSSFTLVSSILHPSFPLSI